MTAEEQAYFDEQMDVLRQDMDAERFERIWNSSRGLTMEQALGETPRKRQQGGHRRILVIPLFAGDSDQPM